MQTEHDSRGDESISQRIGAKRRAEKGDEPEEAMRLRRSNTRQALRRVRS